MAPRSQEPQVETEDSYFGVISFNITPQKKCISTYQVIAENVTIAKERIEDLFKKDFPFDGLTFKISIDKVTSSLQVPTSESAKKKQLKEYLDFLEKKGTGFKIKFCGELKSIRDIKMELGFSVNQELLLDNSKENKNESIPVSQKPTKQVIAEKKPEKNNEWFCVYNIKIGDTKFKKGTKIDKVDNELDARKQLDIYIKRSFSKIRSITKVVITKWNGESDFSEEIIENIPKVIEKVENINSKKTIDELIKENFTQEELNQKFFQVVINPTKPRPRDFEDDFTFYPDNGESDEELFERHKKEIVHMKRKNFAVRRVNMKNLLVTKKMRGILDSKSFREYVENRPENDEDFRPWIKVLEIFSGISKAELAKLQESFDSTIQTRENLINKTFFNKKIG